MGTDDHAEARNRCTPITDRQLLTMSSPPPDVVADACIEIARELAPGRWSAGLELK